jgi:hypothetical protein
MVRKPQEPSRVRFLNKEQCISLAAKISAEMKTYTKDKAEFELERARGKITDKYPMWGPDYDTVVEKIKRLFHPEEAEAIIEKLTA